MNHGFRLADWAADLAAAAADTEAQGGEAAAEVSAARPPSRIANECDLRVYAVTDPDCNAK